MSMICERPPHDRTRAARHIYRQASATELTYIRTRTLVVSRTTIAGTVTREQFETAIDYLEARYGILRTVIENGQFIARTDDASAVKSWSSPESCSADALYATLLNAELDTRRAVYRVHVIAGGDTLDVFMLSSHAVTDATSLVELHSCLAHICDCLVRGEIPRLPAQPFPIPVDAAVSRSLASLPKDGLGNPASYTGAFTEIRLRAPYDGRPIMHRLERSVIDAPQMQRITATAHVQGCSVHSLLLAAFARAIGDVTKDASKDLSKDASRRILMRSSVDMRRRLEPHVSPELVLTAITGHITPVPDLERPLFDIARHIFLDIHEGVTNGLIFHDYENYPTTFGSKRQPPVALNVSDMQAVRFHWPTQRLRVTGFEYACGLSTKFPNVSVSVFDGRLIANTAYVEEFVDPEVMQAICAQAVNRLVSACQ